MSKIIDITIEKEIDCSPSVAKWNYWDHEHLDVIHGGYGKSDILYDKKNFLFRYDLVKAPLIPFYFKTPIFMVQHDDETLYTYAIQLGIVSRTTIKIIEIEPNKTKLIMNYKFVLDGIQIILYPILKFLIPKWNEKVWVEDIPLKLRRQKVLSYNFRDFVGLPDNINDRFQDKIPETILPVKRPLKSSRDHHPLNIKNK